MDTSTVEQLRVRVVSYASKFSMEEWVEIATAILPLLCLLQLFISRMCGGRPSSSKVAPAPGAALEGLTAGSSEWVKALIADSNAQLLKSNDEHKKAVDKAIAALNKRLDETNAKLDKLIGEKGRKAAAGAMWIAGLAGPEAPTVPTLCRLHSRCQPHCSLRPAAPPRPPDLRRRATGGSSFRTSPGAPAKSGKGSPCAGSPCRPAAGGSASARQAGSRARLAARRVRPRQPRRGEMRLTREWDGTRRGPMARCHSPRTPGQLALVSPSAE